MSCEVCPGPEGREVSKVVGARNMSECGGETRVKRCFTICKTVVASLRFKLNGIMAVLLYFTV